MHWFTALDEGVDRGSQDHVKGREDFIQLSPSVNCRWQIHNDQGPLEDGHHNQVRGAGGEILFPPGGGLDSQDADDGINVGGHR